MFAYRQAMNNRKTSNMIYEFVNAEMAEDDLSYILHEIIGIA